MAKKTIKLKKYIDIINEYVSSEAITPGMLVNLTSAGLVSIATAVGTITPKMFALEDELQGKTIDDAYAITTPVQCWSCIPGEEVFAWLANGETAVIGSLLVSDGAGALTVLTPDASAVVIEEYVIGQALEAVDMSGSSGVDPTGRIKVRIL